jgi:hypothetical protein
MLRRRLAAGFPRRHDLFVRVHVLPHARGEHPQGTLPKLRRRIDPATNPAGCKLEKFPASRERIFKPQSCAGRVFRVARRLDKQNNSHIPALSSHYVTIIINAPAYFDRCHSKAHAEIRYH